MHLYFAALSMHALRRIPRPYRHMVQGMYLSTVLCVHLVPVLVRQEKLRLDIGDEAVGIPPPPRCACAPCIQYNYYCYYLVRATGTAAAGHWQ